MLERLNMVFLFVPHLSGTSSNDDNAFSPNYNNVFKVGFENGHVGIHVNSLAAVFSHEAGYWKEESFFGTLKLNDGRNYQDEMYVGFSDAPSRKGIPHNYQILSRSFSNSNFSIGDALITHGLSSFELSNEVDIPVYRSEGFNSLIMKREREDIEDWELEYWSHRISYQVIDVATNGFADENVIGMGSNGKVYKGVWLGVQRLKHRNLVALRGWCKKGRGSLILVYDYMENGSMDKRLFECDVRNYMLSFGDRIKILKDVASGVLYFHEEWEAKVLHRDIKSSNVLLDKEMHARLDDFGLARIYDHVQVANATQVVGTVGYLAPEFVKTGRASTQTDVFGYGVLILEVMCGRRPIEERTDQGFNEEEALRVLQLGMICASLDPKARPTMRQVVKFFAKNCDVDAYEAEDIDVYLRSNTMFSNYRSSIFLSSISYLLDGR
ncbi:hypothetical protein T459_23849 [Capsicum annuum]|uniref:Protein kinase domain-containing protein n=1 Tax=Capsicum annuum TaxID=4072 RepID=A0A2G2YTN6_CAPAN|nr:hypothetical protein T459_23849 [Capsicum annuum]